MGGNMGGSGGDMGGSGGEAPITYNTHIKPIAFFNGLCGLSCHYAGESPLKGNYQMDAYAAVFGTGTDGVPNVIPCNVNSRLITMAASGHQNLSPTDVQLIEDWIVIYNAIE